MAIKTHTTSVIAEAKAEVEAVKAKEAKENSSDFLDSILDSERLSPTMNLPKPNPIISFEKDGFDYPVLTAGNISLVQGKAKSRKTTFLSKVIGAILGAGNGGDDVAFSFEARTYGEKNRVIWFDTEQANYHALRTLKRAVKMSGIFDPVIDFHPLRKYAPEMRIKLIERAIERTTDLCIVIIDGVRDLLYDINDNKEATTLSTDLLRWSSDYDCHIVNVLHENKSDRNSRGVIGTELWNKSETVFRVEANDDGESSTVECVHSRDRNFDAFVFRVDETGTPEIDPHRIAATATVTSSRSRQIKPRIDDLGSEHIKARLGSFMRQNEPESYSTMTLEIRRKFGVGTNLAKDYLRGLIDRKFIEKIDGVGYLYHPNQQTPF